MTFELDEEYIWDFWTAYDEHSGMHHLFFLHAPTSLGDPELRHGGARIGHATSDDLSGWRRVADPLPEPAAFDDKAQWTGCTVRGPGAWWLFTTGLASSDGGRVQRIGSATSSGPADLTEWTRTGLVMRADPAWYQLTCPEWIEESWRDPWVVPDGTGRWHMYITARAAEGTPGCGVVGHAVSDDLVTWEVRPPLSEPTGVFEWMEVIQVVEVEGRWVLLFSCLSGQMDGAPVGSGGVWSVPVDGPGGPVDVGSAVRLTDERFYVGKVVHHRGAPYFMAFRNQGPDGHFLGGLIDPVPVTWRPDGRGLEVGWPDRPPAVSGSVPAPRQPLV